MTSNSVLQRWVIPTLTRSWFLLDVVLLALKPASETNHCWHRSQLGIAWDEALKPLTGFQQRLAPLTHIHTRLEQLHWLWLFGLFALLTIASTEIIGVWVALGLLLTLIRLIIKPLAFQPTTVDACVGLFFFSAFISAAFSSYAITSWVGMAKFSVFFLAYVQFRLLLQPNPWRGILWSVGWLMILGLGQTLIGFYQYINHVQPLATWQDVDVNPELQLTRIFGTLQPSNPNLLAGFLIPILAAGSGLSLGALMQKATWRFGVYGIVACKLMALALVLTGSRGGYLALVVMTAILYSGWGHLIWHHPELWLRFIWKRLWYWGIACIGVVGTVLVLVSPAILNRIQSIGVMREDSSNSFRLNVWAATWSLIKDNWLIGIGPGNDTFKKVYGLYMVSGYSALSAYSIFLEMWAEQGILGLILFLLLLAVIALRWFMTLDSAQSLLEKMTLVGLTAAIFGSVMYGTFDTIWYRPSVNLVFWLMVAAFATLSEAALISWPTQRAHLVPKKAG